MASPPKPWERQGAAGASSGPAPSTTPLAPAATSSPLSATAPATATTTTSTTSPAIPARPASLAAAVNQNAAAYSRLGAAPAYSGYGAAGYGATGYGAAAYTPYNRYGGYGGYGGGMYGGYGGGYGGMYGGGMYGGMPGMQPNPNDPNSLTSRFGMSTQATFQMLEGIVGAFGGFAQMLESTYMATHSSFFAMVAVAEQFSTLRDTLGSVLGIFTVMRWLRTLFAKVTGRPLPADAMALTPAAFARFEGRSLPPSADGSGAGAHPKPSRKPLFFFILAAFGLPYLMSKLIKTLAASAEEEERRRMALMQTQQQQQQQVMDPSQLEFCRVVYDFTPEQSATGAAVPGVDLAVKKGDLVAVISKSDPLGNPSEWWRCRTRDGRMGYLPATFLEVARRPGQPLAAIKATAASDSSRANSLTSTGTGAVDAAIAAAAAKASASKTPAPAGKSPAAAAPPALPESKVGDVSVESFQKSTFYQ